MLIESFLTFLCKIICMVFEKNILFYTFRFNKAYYAFILLSNSELEKTFQSNYFYLFIIKYCHVKSSAILFYFFIFRLSFKYVTVMIYFVSLSTFLVSSIFNVYRDIWRKDLDWTEENTFWKLFQRNYASYAGFRNRIIHW